MKREFQGMKETLVGHILLSVRHIPMRQIGLHQRVEGNTGLTPEKL